MPETGAAVFIPWLMTKYPGEYTLNQTRTLQRRIAQWRLDQGSQEEKMRKIMTTETPWPAVPIEIAASQPSE